MHTEPILHPKWLFNDAIKFLEIANHHHHRWCVQMNAWLHHNIASFCTQSWKRKKNVNFCWHFFTVISIDRSVCHGYDAGKPQPINNHIFSSIIQFDGQSFEERKNDIIYGFEYCFASVIRAACFCTVNFDKDNGFDPSAKHTVNRSLHAVRNYFAIFFVGDRSVRSNSLFCKHFNSVEK